MGDGLMRGLLGRWRRRLGADGELVTWLVGIGVVVWAGLWVVQEAFRDLREVCRAFRAAVRAGGCRG